MGNLATSKNSSRTKAQRTLATRGYTLEGVALSVYLYFSVYDFLAIQSGISIARVVAIAFLVFAALRYNKIVIRQNPTTLALFLLSMSGILSLFFIQGFGAINLYYSFFINIVITAFAVSFSYTREDEGLAKRSLVFGAISIGILMIAFPSNLHSTGRSVINLFGSMQDPNELCGYFLFGAAFAYVNFFSSDSKQKVIYLIILLLLFYTVLSTGSRGGLIAFFATIVVASFFAVTKSRSRLFLTLTIVFALYLVILNLPLILSLFPPDVSARLSTLTLEADTAQTRLKRWSEILVAFNDSSVLEKLFGHGLGSTTLITGTGHVAHNAYLELLYCFGIFGLVSELILIVSVLKRAVAERNHSCVAALIGFMVLWISLSAISFKALWALIIVSSLEVDDSPNRNKAQIDHNR